MLPNYDTRDRDPYSKVRSKGTDLSRFPDYLRRLCDFRQVLLIGT